MKKKSKEKTIRVAGNKPKAEPTTEEKMEAAQYLLNAPSTAAQVVWATRLNDPLASRACLTKEIDTRSKAIIAGDMKEVENLLISQAYALNSIFCDSLYKAMGMTPQYVPNLKSVNEIYAKIGLKAQAQCRATLETLATIKNPPHLAFIRQQYVAYQQQVNNQEGIPTQPGNNIDVTQDNRELPALGKAKISKNKLLETSNNVTRLDTRKTKKTSEIDKEMETVE